MIIRRISLLAFCSQCVFLCAVGTHLHQQLSAEGVIVVVWEDLGQLAEGTKTLPENKRRGK